MDASEAMDMAPSVAVHTVGMSAGSVGIWTGVLGFFGVVIAIWPKLAKINADQSGHLNVILMQRLAKIEADMADQLKRCAQEQAGMRKEWEDERRTMREEWETEKSSMRRQIRGLQAQLIQYQISSGGALPLHVSADQKDLIDRIITAMEDPKPKKLSILRRKRRPRNDDAI